MMKQSKLKKRLVFLISVAIILSVSPRFPIVQAAGIEIDIPVLHYYTNLDDYDEISEGTVLLDEPANLLDWAETSDSEADYTVEKIYVTPQPETESVTLYFIAIDKQFVEYWEDLGEVIDTIIVDEEVGKEIYPMEYSYYLTHPDYSTPYAIYFRGNSYEQLSNPSMMIEANGDNEIYLFYDSGAMRRVATPQASPRTIQWDGENGVDTENDILVYDKENPDLKDYENYVFSDEGSAVKIVYSKNEIVLPEPKTVDVNIVHHYILDASDPVEVIDQTKTIIVDTATDIASWVNPIYNGKTYLYDKTVMEANDNETAYTATEYTFLEDVEYTVHFYYTLETEKEIDEKTNEDIPSTGDENHIFQYVFLMVAALMFIFFKTRYMWKDQK